MLIFDIINSIKYSFIIIKNIRRERNIVMKKNGFTLAEVLITLAIIGVVATMTLPALMTNTAEQQAKSALKKGINTFTEAAQMSQAIDGYDYSSLNVDTKNEDAQSLYGLLARRTAVDFGKVGTAVTNYPNTSGNYLMFFRDGSAISFPSGSTGTAAAQAAIQADGLPYGIAVMYDTNGIKGPNLLSNCNNVPNQVATASYKDSTNSNPSAQCTKARRQIKDQFGIRLRGGFAVPNGAAARWAFEG